MMAKRGFNNIIVYLDGFLIIGKSRVECKEALSVLLQLLWSLRFQISWRKVIDTSQKLVFVGVELETLCFEMLLPPNKIAELQQSGF